MKCLRLKFLRCKLTSTCELVKLQCRDKLWCKFGPFLGVEIFNDNFCRSWINYQWNLTAIAVLLIARCHSYEGWRILSHNLLHFVWTWCIKPSIMFKIEFETVFLSKLCINEEQIRDIINSVWARKFESECWVFFERTINNEWKNEPKWLHKRIEN